MHLEETGGDTNYSVKFEYELSFAAAGCNRNTGCIHALPSRNLVAYGSAGNVFVLVDSGRQVSAALPFHSAPVTCVRLVESPSSIFIIASSSSGKIAVWESTISKDECEYTRWNEKFSWDTKCESVVAVDAYWSKQRSKLIICSVGFDCRLCIWTCDISTGTTDTDGVNLRCECITQVQNSLPECIAICTDLEQDVSEREGSSNPCGLLIAVGGTHERLQIYATDSDLKTINYTVGLHCHRDWIRGIAFSPALKTAAGTSRYLATASKDSTVRMWNLTQLNISDTGNDAESKDEFEKLGPPRADFEFDGKSWELTASALLQEHSKSVHSVFFQVSSPIKKDSSFIPRLVTASLDCSIAIWQHENGFWECGARFGLLGGSGAHALGFFGAVFASEGCTDVIGHNFGGAIHCWRSSSVDNEDGGKLGINDNVMEMNFLADHSPGGHFSTVTDFDWESHGDFLITSSEDKTVRIFRNIDNRFVEWARPQTHGHAIHAVALTNSSGTKYISGSEESMLREFCAPETFALKTFTPVAAGAVVPELGLSNKAVYEDNKTNGNQKKKNEYGGGMEISSFGSGRSKSKYPIEEELKQNTLWPETAKLYGHGNIISCIAVAPGKDSSDGLDVLATACFAQKEKDAGIRIWNKKCEEQYQLLAHELTVTNMKFSKDGTALLSLSRDRSFAVHSRSNAEGKFELLHRTKRAHARLIYDGDWMFGTECVATCGRDKYLRIFSVVKGSVAKEVYSQKFGISPCAIAVNETIERCIMALAFEDGSLEVFSVGRRCGDMLVNQIGKVPRRMQCSDLVTRIRWRPDRNGNILELGVVSTDHSVRVLRLKTKQ